MNTTRVEKPLLYKELRESSLMLLALALLSVAGYVCSLMEFRNQWLSPLFRFGPSVIVAFWGAVNGSRLSSKAALEVTHLPVTRQVLWGVQFCAPLCILAAVVVFLEPVSSSCSGSLEPALLLTRVNYPALLAIFAVSYFLSSLSSVGVAAVAGASMAVLAPIVYDPSDIGFIWAAARIGAGCCAASFMLSGLPKRDVSTTRLRRYASVSVLIIAFLMPVGNPTPGRNSRETAFRSFTPKQYMSRDGASRVQPGEDALLSSGETATEAEFCNYRTGVRRSSFIELNWLALGTTDDNRVYFLQGRPTESSTRVLEWDVVSDEIHTLVTLPVSPDFSRVLGQGTFSSIEPSGKYLIVRLPAVRGSRLDLWLVDLARRDAVVVLQNASLLNTQSAVWLPDKVLIPNYRNRIVQIDLGPNRASYRNLHRRTR